MANKFINTKAVFRKEKKRVRVDIQKQISLYRFADRKLDVKGLNLDNSEKCESFIYEAHRYLVRCYEMAIATLVNKIRESKSAKTQEDLDRIKSEVAEYCQELDNSIEEKKDYYLTELLAEYSTEETSAVTVDDVCKEIDFYIETCNIPDYLISGAVDKDGKRITMCYRSRGGTTASIKSDVRDKFFILYDAKRRLNEGENTEEVLADCRSAYDAIMKKINKSKDMANEHIKKNVLKYYPDAVFEEPVAVKRDAADGRRKKAIKKITETIEHYRESPLEVTITKSPLAEKDERCVQCFKSFETKFKTMEEDFLQSLESIKQKLERCKDYEEINVYNLRVKYVYEHFIKEANKLADRTTRQIEQYLETPADVIIGLEATLKTRIEGLIHVVSSTPHLVHKAEDTFKYMDVEDRYDILETKRQPLLEELNTLLTNLSPTVTKDESKAILTKCSEIQSEWDKTVQAIYTKASETHEAKVQSINKEKEMSEESDSYLAELESFIESVRDASTMAENAKKNETDPAVLKILDKQERDENEIRTETLSKLVLLRNAFRSGSTLETIKDHVASTLTNMHQRLVELNEENKNKIDKHLAECETEKVKILEEEKVMADDVQEAMLKDSSNDAKWYEEQSLKDSSERQNTNHHSAADSILDNGIRELKRIIDNRLRLIEIRDEKLLKQFSDVDESETRSETIDNLKEIVCNLELRKIGYADILNLSASADNAWSIYRDHVVEYDMRLLKAKTDAKEKSSEEKLLFSENKLAEVNSQLKDVAVWAEDILDFVVNDKRTKPMIGVLASKLYLEAKQFLKKHQ